MSRKSEDKYLSQVLHEDGLAASVAATVASRAGKFKGAIFEIRSVIEEFTMQTMGGMMAAKTLLERALLLSLLSGGCNWTGISKKTEDDCDDLILMYWRVMMKVSESTPKIGLIAESATVRSKWRIWKQKISLVDAIKKLDNNTLAKETFNDQLALGLPGLVQEVKEICRTIQIPDITENNVTREEVKDALEIHHLKNIKEEMGENVKHTDMKNEDLIKP